MNTIKDFVQYAQKELSTQYSEQESRTICNIIFYNTLKYTNIDIHLKKNDILEKSIINIFIRIVEELKKDIPIQYVLGQTDFDGLIFKLNKHTLIPRGETEELVLWANDFIERDMKILDIGTGSGCIAISIAKRNPSARCEGIDISKEAIKKANENAISNEVNIKLYERDILKFEDYEWKKYDLIISNPPYVTTEDKALMHKRVLEYEPHTALFVSEEPLIFYRRIGEFGLEHLKKGGLIFFEINEKMGHKTVEVLESIGYKNIELRRDIYDKDRFIKAGL